MIKSLLLAAFALAASPAFAAPQTFALDIQDGRLTGPGAEILHADLPKAQFILYGEDHGFADSPVVLRALARDARPFGFNHLVVEVGPISTAMAGDALAAKGLDGEAALLRSAPMGFPFLSLKDDALLASDFLGHDSKGIPYLWGVDQEFILSPQILLPRLIALAPNQATHDKLEEMLKDEKAAVVSFDQGKFILSRFTNTDFDTLARAFAGRPEALRIVEAMRESAAIYQLWMGGHNYENNERRAELIARNFLARYRAAADGTPKVIFKMGAEHTAIGTTTINTVDLGTLASSIARANGMKALRILFLPAGGQNLVMAPKAGQMTQVMPYDASEAKEFFDAIGVTAASLPQKGWTLIPLEPVRRALDNKGIDALKPDARFLLLGFDYVITTPEARAAALVQ
jgi:hypothetical protein